MVVVPGCAGVGLLLLAPDPPNRAGLLLPGGGEGGILLGPVAGAQVHRAGDIAAQRTPRHSAIQKKDVTNSMKIK